MLDASVVVVVQGCTVTSARGGCQGLGDACRRGRHGACDPSLTHHPEHIPSLTPDRAAAGRSGLAPILDPAEGRVLQPAASNSPGVDRDVHGLPKVGQRVAMSFPRLRKPRGVVHTARRPLQLSFRAREPPIVAAPLRLSFRAREPPIFCRNLADLGQT